MNIANGVATARDAKSATDIVNHTWTSRSSYSEDAVRLNEFHH
jgi:hypothetical protein